MICVIEASAFVAVLLSEPERAALIRATKGADLVAPEVDLTRSLKLAAERGIYAYDAYLLTCAKQHRAPLLDRARRDGAVRIRRRDGQVFVVRPETATASPLNVPGLRLALTRDDIVSLIRKRRRPV